MSRCSDYVKIPTSILAARLPPAGRRRALGKLYSSREIAQPEPGVKQGVRSGRPTQ